MQMTVSLLKEIISRDVPFQLLEENTPVIEFFTDGNLSLGICCVTRGFDFNNDSQWYVLNIFHDGEYVSCLYDPRNQGLNDTVYQDIADKWNRLAGKPDRRTTTQNAHA